jgi:hypothetical protein
MVLPRRWGVTGEKVTQKKKENKKKEVGKVVDPC